MTANRAKWTVYLHSLKMFKSGALAEANTVIAFFKGPLLCEDTMEWPFFFFFFCDCSSHHDQRRSLSFLSAWRCCHSNGLINASEQHFLVEKHYSGRSRSLAVPLLCRVRGWVMFWWRTRSQTGGSHTCHLAVLWQSGSFWHSVWITNLLWKYSSDERGPQEM